uniref:Uncharacterized protein n=1 Tax=Panagrolaimus sp. ES5 TaxID=591445 RepID=A0AC34F1V8_9BILA
MMSTQMPHPGMMPPNGYMGYPGMSMMPSTSNGMMCNFSMDDPNMRNSGSPMMMQQQQQPQNSPIINGPGPSNFMPGPGHLQQFPSSMPSFHSQNPSQYSSNGQPLQQQQQFQNPGMPPPQQYFSNHQQQQLQQQIPTTASPSRLNTPNYPPSNASNANNNNNNNTPTYPNHNGTPTYSNPSNMQQNNPTSFSNNGSQIQNFPSQMSSDFLHGQDERNNANNANPEHMIPNYQNGEENGYNNFIGRDTNGFQGPPGPMPPPPFQRQMSSTNSNMMGVLPPIKKTNKTMLFNSDMLMEMINSGNESPQSFSNNMPTDYNVQMSDFNSPSSINSLPDINNGVSVLNGGAQMPPDNYGPKREKKDDDGPLQCIERMTQQTLDRSPKLNNRVDTGRRQEDKKQKMAKLESIASDLNLTPGDFPSPMLRPPMGMPPGAHPSMMMQMQGQMRPPFPPGFDPHNMQGGGRPPQMMFPPGHPMSMHPGGMPPNFMPSSNIPHSQNGMMPYPGMASASPKFPMMPQQPPMMSPQQGNMPYPMSMDPRGMRPPQQMNDMMWRQHQMMQMQQQQHQNGQMPL